MLVPLDWLSEHVELAPDTTGEQVAASLVSVGLEEEGLHGGDVTGPLVVGRVLEVSPEPQKNGKVISWCQVDVGEHGQRLSEGSPQGIVCGAPNLQVGSLVAVILPGGVLPGGMTISARKTYGHLSAGMICSARELGLGEDGDGIILLEDYLDDGARGLEPGDDLIGLLGLGTETVEVNVTPDRGYCFSIRGIAREYSHATGSTFRDPVAPPAGQAAGHEPGGPVFEVRLEDAAAVRGVAGCDRYVARVVRGLDLDAPTPRWMQRRLSAAGMRPISLAVDVTNYVMLATGQPLHAFDLAALHAPLTVRRAHEGESLTTLDGASRSLHPEDLLITDASQVLALAGVMGGESSEVGPGTTDVLIEAAHFDARSVGRTARRHRLPSEASKRFERGVDPDITGDAALMACELLVRFGGGQLDDATTDVDHRPDAVAIDLEPDLPTRYVGVPYTRARVVEVLQQIGCRVESAAHAGDQPSGDQPSGDQAQQDDAPLRVWPPSWRPDLTDPTTLVEEVARIDGYDKIPSVLPAAPGGRGLTHPQRLRRVVATALAGQGLAEVLTYPFVGAERMAAFGLSADDPRADAVRLANPLSEESPLMRTEVLQTLVDTLRRNVARGVRDVALFEIDTVARAGSPRSAPTPGTGVRPDDDTLERIHAAVPKQGWHVGIVASGAVERPGWWGAGRAVQASDAVAWARSVSETAGLGPVEAVADDHAPWHPGRCVRLEVAGAVDDGPRSPRIVLGWAGELHPQVIAQLGLPERTVAAEVDLDAVSELSTGHVRARPLSVHPPAVSDVALSLPRTVPNAAVEASLRAGAGPLLESIGLFDVYLGEQVADREKSLAFRLVFRAPDRTLRTDEVNEARDAAVRRAAEDHQARQR